MRLMFCIISGLGINYGFVFNDVLGLLDFFFARSMPLLGF